MSALNPASALAGFATPRRDLFPLLAFPFYHIIQGRAVTAAADGFGALVWTFRRVPGFRDYQPDNGSLYKPADLAALHLCGGSSPPPPPPRRISPLGVSRIAVGQYFARIPQRLHAACAVFDSCYFTVARTPGNYAAKHLPAVSFSWTLGPVCGRGIILDPAYAATLIA